ncbi:MAG: response regulator [Ilumatobacter sp.]|uniref:response regulator n=1 Tax=Ilumatobacter sp. TaxID=1967498 RepID=UPI00262D208F|nr:response regulator [Ilumatobacter sp.]MDJ0767372.1 response regulator [Ilumatobacter sp.]
MTELVILVVEDEPEVRAAIVRDLAPLSGTIRVDEADTVDDALAALEECTAAGDRVGLILADHRLPGRSGVDLLVSLHAEPATRPIRKVLITGQAGHQDTIRAINDAGLAHYIAKPWEPDDLRATAIDQLTDYVIDEGLDPLAFVQVLDGPRLLDEYSRASRSD